MANTWRHCAEQALTLADWVGTPQVRVLQALCLLMNFQDGKSAHPTAGSTGESDVMSTQIYSDSG
jgi:hypothetical protein